MFQGKLTEDFQNDFDANKVETRSKVEDISGCGKEAGNGKKRRRTTKRKEVRDRAKISQVHYPLLIGLLVTKRT